MCKIYQLLHWESKRTTLLLGVLLSALLFPAIAVAEDAGFAESTNVAEESSFGESEAAAESGSVADDVTVAESSPEVKKTYGSAIQKIYTVCDQSDLVCPFLMEIRVEEVIFDLSEGKIQPVLDIAIRAPVFLWLGSLTLLIVTFYFMLCLMIQCWRVNRKLKKGARRVVKGVKKGESFDAESLEKVSAHLLKNKLLKEIWSEFEETLIYTPDPQGGPKKVFNTHQAEEYFKREHLVDKHIWWRFYDAFPGILTGIGLLLTFLAILFGLSHVEIIEASGGQAGEVTGIAELVSNLSGKFVSSVIALLCAVIFTFSEKFFLSFPYASYHRFVGAVNSRFDRRSSEKILEEVLISNNHLADAMRTFNTDLSGKLKQGVEEGFAPLGERLADAIENLTKTTAEMQARDSDSFAKSMEGVADMVREQITGTAGGQFEELTSSLTNTTQFLTQMNEQSAATNDRTDRLIAQLDSFFNKQSSAGDEQISKMRAGMDDVLQNLMKSSNEITHKLAMTIGDALIRIEEVSKQQVEESMKQSESLRELVEGLSQQMLSNMQKSAEEMNNGVGQMLQSAMQSSTKLGDDMSTRFVELIERLDESTTKQIEESMKQTASMKELMAQMSSQIHSSLSSSADAMNTTVNSMITESKEHSDQTFRMLSQIVREQGESADLVSQAKSALTESLHTFRSSINDASGTLNGLRNTSESFQRTSVNIQDGIRQIGEIQANAAQVVAATKGGSEELSRTIQQQSEVLQSYERVFGQLDQSMGSLLEQVANNINKYNELVRGSLQVALKEFDGSLADATKRLGNVVGELNEGLEELSDTVSRSSHSNGMRQ